MASAESVGLHDSGAFLAVSHADILAPRDTDTPPSVSATIPFRAVLPVPIALSVMHVPHLGGDGCTTGIKRHWAHGDPAKCGRCTVCTADSRDSCMVGVPEFIADKDAAQFSLAAWRLAHGG